MKNSFKQNLSQLFHLVKRNFLVFVTDKVAFGFSFLSPAIVFLLFIVFLGKTQVDSIMNNFKNLSEADYLAMNKIVTSVITNWMTCSVMATSVITVTLGAASKMVDDKIQKTEYVLNASPIEGHVLIGSYVISTSFSALLVNTVIYSLTFIYLAITHAFYITIKMAFFGLLVILISILATSTIFLLIVNFLSKPTEVAVFSSLISVVGGFMVGGYFPITKMPLFLQRILTFVPGYYSLGLFRKVFLSNTYIKIEETIKALPNSNQYNGFLRAINRDFGPSLDFWGHELKAWHMFLALILTAITFFSIFLIIKHFQFKKRRFFAKQI
ncbi:ABC transporter permease [Metamycoplasma equirhinis]|uniref:ABC transporter permease n=2 Tax=Metamycoplasma equirhinis TaxID=92402 RepID=UPI003593A081